MAQGRPAEACPKLEESQRLDPGSGTLLNLARCYEQAGRFASAWNQYLEAASAARVAGNAEREGEARRRAEALRPRLPSLVISLSTEARAVPGLEVLRDGVLVGAPQLGVPIPTDAGEHTLEARAPGRVPWKTVVTLKGESHTATVTVPTLAVTTATAPAPAAAAATAPAPTQEPSAASSSSGLGTRRTLALVAGGAGVVGLGVGTAFGLKSKSHHDEAEKYCDGSVCNDPRGVTAGNDAYAAGNVATVFTIVGVVGVAAGVVLWVTAPSPSASSVQVGFGPGVARIRGVF
jgi:serine/threonine-protein kinase